MNQKILRTFFSLLIWVQYSPSFTQNTQEQNPIPRYQSLEAFATALVHLEKMYVDPEKVQQDPLILNALNGLMKDLDPHSVILPPKAFEQLTMDTRGKFGGIGIIVSQNKPDEKKPTSPSTLMIVSVIEGTPAAKGGLKAGDEITAIDDVSLITITPNEAVERMQGSIGSTVELTLRREGLKETFSVQITRALIKAPSVHARDLGAGIITMSISSFQENTARQLRKKLKLYQPKMKALILDLRNNPGGLLDQSVKVVDLFVDSGLIVSTVGRDSSRIEREYARKNGTYAGFPMITLVNQGSASASEIVAGALQDHKRSLIMGTPTFGKGSVQTLIPLPNKAGLKLTIARYYTPLDRSIQGKGITPDLIVSNQENKQQATRKEADLKGHISGGHLSEISKGHSLRDPVKKWPKPLRKDHQLVTAFVHLRAWATHLQEHMQAQQKINDIDQKL
ncbi:MAG: S41 family peptidase [Oligoflexales bacterium]